MDTWPESLKAYRDEQLRWKYRRTAAYSFQTDHSWGRICQLLKPRSRWVGLPDNDGKWLQRDNDRWDYFSWSKNDTTFRKSIAIFPDSPESYITAGLTATIPDIEREWQDLLCYVLDTLLPSMNATNVQASDFEK